MTPAPAPPIDLEEFRAAMRDSGIEEIVVPMLQLFAQEAPKGMAALESAMSAGDLETASRAAHSLKSSAGNVRAKLLAARLQEMEGAAKADDAERSSRLLAEVRQAHDDALRHLAEQGIVG